MDMKQAKETKFVMRRDRKERPLSDQMRLSILHDKIKYDEALPVNLALQVANTQIIRDEQCQLTEQPRWTQRPRMLDTSASVDSGAAE